MDIDGIVKNSLLIVSVVCLLMIVMFWMGAKSSNDHEIEMMKLQIEMYKVQHK